MKVDVYPSALKQGKYLVVPAGTDLSTWPAPPGFAPDLEQVYPLQTTLDILPTDVGRIADPKDVINQVDQKGWAEVEVTSTIKVGLGP